MIDAIVYSGDDQKFVPYEFAVVPVSDIGFERGVSVFETILSIQGNIIDFPLHWKRLKNSLKKTPINFTESEKDILLIIKKGLDKFFGKNVTIKIIVTGGDGSYLRPSKKARFLIIFSLHHAPEPEFYRKGVKLSVFQQLRSFPEIKTLNYFEASLGYKKALKEKSFDAVHINSKKEVFEGTTFSLALIKDGIIYIRKDGVLESTTLKRICFLAKKMKIKVSSKNFFLKDFKSADEVFLASSNRGLLPVREIGGIKIKGVKKNEDSINKKLYEAYSNYTGYNFM